MLFVSLKKANLNTRHSAFDERGRACKTGGGNLKNPLMNAGIPRQETGNACFHHIKV